MENINIELSSMLFDNMHLMKLFNKDSYKEAFGDYCDKYAGFFSAVDKGFNESEDKDAYVRELAEAFAKTAAARADEVKKKSERTHFLIDHNMILTVYVLPSLVNTKTESCRKLADAIAVAWNGVFKGNSISVGTFEEIDGGFKRKLCYITTAVCRSLGKDDDCYELCRLRDYRDSYLLSCDDGRDVVNTYYNIAPTIVNRINKGSEATQTYKTIFNRYISPCISLIEEEKYEECKELYSDMVYSLKEKYLN